MIATRCVLLDLATHNLHGVTADRLHAAFQVEWSEKDDHRVRPLWFRIRAALAADGYAAPESHRDASSGGSAGGSRSCRTPR